MASNPSPDSHPCIRCGACCGYFRVEFYWRETDPDSLYKVPPHLTEDLDSFKKCMKGTGAKKPIRCTALNGKIGVYAYCSIYLNRPAPCRAFQASYENGIQNKRCDEARLNYGLKPLTLGDWPTP